MREVFQPISDLYKYNLGDWEPSVFYCWSRDKIFERFGLTLFFTDGEKVYYPTTDEFSSFTYIGSL